MIHTSDEAIIRLLLEKKGEEKHSFQLHPAQQITSVTCRTVTDFLISQHRLAFKPQEWDPLDQSKKSRPVLCVRRTHIGACLFLLVLLALTLSQAQNTPNLRKLVYKVAPKYPRELKQNAIGGIVRLSISISPNGSVGKISPIGGNPILVDAATLAVRQWKYVPSDRPTTTEIQLDFIPSQQ